MYKKYLVGIFCVFLLNAPKIKRASQSMRLYDKLEKLRENDKDLFLALANHLKINVPLALSETQENTLDSLGLLPGKSLAEDDRSFIAHSIVYSSLVNGYILESPITISQK